MAGRLRSHSTWPRIFKARARAGLDHHCPSIITAHANDDGFETFISTRPWKLLDEDDPIFIFSCSGKSPNYESFVEGERFLKRKNPVVSIVGTDGGFLKTKSDVSIHVKSDDYQVCETAFSVVADILVKSLLEG
jgi:phosphoheptose isomerase